MYKILQVTAFYGRRALQVGGALALFAGLMPSRLMPGMAIRPCFGDSQAYYFIAHAGPGDPYWSIQAKAVQSAAQKLGIRVVFSAPEKPGDVARQVELLNAAIAARPKGIATTIPNAQAFSRSIKNAIAKGIPVVAVNAREAKRNPQLLPYQAYIGMDEGVAGEKVAQRAVKQFQLKSGDEVLIAHHEPGVMSLETRVKGIQKGLSEFQIKNQQIDITSNPVKAQAILQSYLRSHPKTQVIFTLGALGFMPAGKVLSEPSQKGKVHLVGFDIDPVGFELISRGIMDFTIDAQPYMQGFMAVNQLYLAAQFKVTPADLDTGSSFLDSGNFQMLSELIRKGYEL